MLVKEKILQLKSVFDLHTVGDFNTSLSKTDQSFIRNTKERNTGAKRHYKPNVLNRTLQDTSPKPKRIRLLISTYGTVSKIDHILCCKASLNRLRNAEKGKTVVMM